MSKEKHEAPSFTFDPARDISPVEQFGYIDLVAANLTSSVPASITVDEAKYNGIEDPGAIAGRPRDVFEQAQASKAVLGYKAPSPDNVQEPE